MNFVNSLTFARTLFSDPTSSWNNGKFWKFNAKRSARVVLLTENRNLNLILKNDWIILPEPGVSFFSTNAIPTKTDDKRQLGSDSIF